MRKDVRLGFAVGGVLLAVIIVAILVIHRSKSREKAVAFDPGSKEAVAPATDATSTPPDRSDSPSNATPITPTTPAAPRDPGDDQTVASRPDVAAKSPAGDSAEKDDKSVDRWGVLFASTSDDPIRAQLTSPRAAKPLQHKNGPASLDRPADDAGANTEMLAAPAAPARLTTPPANVDRTDATTPRTHKIQSGETFVSISKAVYGDGRYFKAIADANPTVTPEKLRPGMMIQLPPASEVKQSSRSAKSNTAARTAAGPALSADGKTYTVQKNDNLYKIAKQLYGKGEKEGDLYTANKDTIGPDSTRLKIGMVLRLPEQPTSSR